MQSEVLSLIHIFDERNDDESFVFQTEDALKQVGDSVDAADTSAVEADIAAVKMCIRDRE